MKSSPEASESTPWVCTNVTRGTVLGNRIRIANSFWSRFRGLMGRRQINRGEGLWITSTNSVHNLFPILPDAIDVIFLDDRNQVVRTCPHLKRWRISPIVRGATVALELPDGVIAESDTRVGDLIQLAKP